MLISGSRSDWTPNPLLRGALAAAAAGLRAFPAHSPAAWPVPGVGDPALDCSCQDAGCPAPGAHPRWLDWQEVATTDAARLHAFWADSPAANPAVVTGETIDVLEVPAEAGERTAVHLARLVEDFPVARTGSGSWHFYLRATGLQRLILREDPGDQGQPGGSTVLHGRDSWVLVPPARHVGGGAARWQRSLPGTPLPSLTLADLRRLTEPSGSRRKAHRRRPPGEGQGGAHAAPDVRAALTPTS